MGMTFGAALLVAILAAIFRSEFEAWMPWLAERLRRKAVRHFDGALKERLDEEWAAYLREVPGNTGKLLCAFGFCVSALKIKCEDRLNLARFYFYSFAFLSLYRSSQNILAKFQAHANSVDYFSEQLAIEYDDRHAAGLRASAKQAKSKFKSYKSVVKIQMQFAKKLIDGREDIDSDTANSIKSIIREIERDLI